MRRSTATAILSVALALTAVVGGLRAAAAAGRQADRFAGQPPSAGLDATVARFVPVPRGFSATIASVHALPTDRFYLAYDAQGAGSITTVRPWVLTLALGRALLPAVRTLDRADATLIVTLGRVAGPEAFSDPAGTFTINRVGRVGG